MAQRGETEDGLGWGGLVASKAELREERRLAALEKDAERYRWLRDTGAAFTVRSSGGDGRLCKVYQIGRQAAGLDEAIDAAMATAQTQQQPDGR